MTARCYATWAEGAEYREPPRRRPGELYPDLLARLGGEDAAGAEPANAAAGVAAAPLMH